MRNLRFLTINGILSFVTVCTCFTACLNTGNPEAQKIYAANSNVVDSTLNVGPAIPSSKKGDFHDMILFEGGEITIGANTGVMYQGPVFKTLVPPFYLDVHPVTVSEFRQFVEETRYRTDAEKFGNAGVFNLSMMRWELVENATWHHPFGPGGQQAIDDHPVTQVSWLDAMAYCQWAGKRLPAETEWEYAARNGKPEGVKYYWGNEIRPAGKYMANYWQGEMGSDQGADGFKYTSPVGYYGIMQNGLTDMAGNVWEWCENTFTPYPDCQEYYRYDPNVKAIRGGSFFYDEAGEESLTVYFRAYNSLETSLFNMGFRCAADKAK